MDWEIEAFCEHNCAIYKEAEHSSQLSQAKNDGWLIPQLAIDTDFFHSAVVNPCTMWNQRRSRSGVCLTAHLAIESLMANYCMRLREILKGISQDWGWADFSIKPPWHFLYLLNDIYWMSLISAWFSLDSTLKSAPAGKIRILLSLSSHSLAVGTSDFNAQMFGIKFWKGDENLRPFNN